MWGDPGDLVFWSTAQPLLDGAMPSLVHRQLLEGMVDELVAFHAANAYDAKLMCCGCGKWAIANKIPKSNLICFHWFLRACRWPYFRGIYWHYW